MWCCEHLCLSVSTLLLFSKAVWDLALCLCLPAKKQRFVGPSTWFDMYLSRYTLRNNTEEDECKCNSCLLLIRVVLEPTIQWFTAASSLNQGQSLCSCCYFASLWLLSLKHTKATVIGGKIQPQFLPCLDPWSTYKQFTELVGLLLSNQTFIFSDN